MIFKNRQDAGRQLASMLVKYRNKQAIVLALPRGGIPIGFEIAKFLDIQMDVLVVRKIGTPIMPEFGIGAIGENETLILDEHTIKGLNISKSMLEVIINTEKKELNRRIALYRGDRKLPNLHERTIILVDDGLATGVTARAGVASIKKQKPKKLIFASPVCALDTAEVFKNLVDEVICVATPIYMESVGSWYKDFRQVSDGEVVELLNRTKTKDNPIVDHSHTASF